MAPSTEKLYSWNGRIIAKDSDIIESRIVRCNITEIPLPVNDGDAVPLIYLKNTITNSNYSIIPFYGEEWVDITEMPRFGNRSITVNSITEGGPNASWQVSKSMDNSDATITALAYSAASDGCIFELSWLPNTCLQLRKSTAQWDGQYELSIARA